MEALDNPSYFTLSGGSTSIVPTSSPSSRSPFSLLKRRGGTTTMGANTSSGSSSCTASSLVHHGNSSSSAPCTPTEPGPGPLYSVPPGSVPLAPQPQHRRSFRSLLRSMSANHNNSTQLQIQQQLLVLGEPRPSDVAPASPCLSPHKDDHQRHRRNHSTKTAKNSMELLSNDMVYCPVPGRPELGSEEVLLGRGDARYYNLTASITIPPPGCSTTGKRRHSIGTFLNKDRSATLTKPTASPSADAAPCQSQASAQDSPGEDGSPQDLTRPAHSRKRCTRCCGHKNIRAVDMCDILILSSQQSEAASLWVKYLNTCFEQISKKGNRSSPLKVLCMSLEDVLGPGELSSTVEEKMANVKLQIVIVCPQFLEHVYQNPGTALGKTLQPDRVLAMLLGVEEETVTEHHRAALITYQQWHKLLVKDQDMSFVGNFLKVAMDILAKVSRQNSTQTEKAHFSVMPKKVKESQNRVIVLLNEPIAKEDQIKVSVDKNGERLDITTVKRRNPYTIHFQMPESCLEVSMIVNVYVQKNEQMLGSRQVKCESRMRELDQVLRSLDNPLEFMCQTLGFSPGSREYLDNFLVTALQRNIPPHFNILHTQTGHYHRSHASPEEYPTLLHFAAKFGLEKLAWQLLECPGGEQACDLRNVCEITPAEMAEGAGHTKLAHALRGYMQMTELTSMYSYLKIMSEGNSKFTDFSEVEYHQPRPLSETYQVPPAIPRAVHNHMSGMYQVPPSNPRSVMDHYQVPPSARPFTPLLHSGSELGGYMEMHPSSGQSVRSLKHSLDFLNTVATTPDTQALSRRSASPVLTTHSSASRHHPDHSEADSPRTETGPGDRKSQEQLSQGAQDELLEIINDFKNNVFTISEVEKLVDSWRNRNDVQQSFKDKQEQLNEMREEYDRLQMRLKDHMKRATPFDRIRNFFKTKSKEPKGVTVDNASGVPADTNKALGLDPMSLCQRPVSSLSLHSSCSSSSSGRMSTVSACSGVSLGDSGTHSDLEERKQMLMLHYDKVSRSGFRNYEIPPAPRPITQLRSSPTQFSETQTQLNTIPIEDRPPQPVPRNELPDYNEGSEYIIPLATPSSVTDEDGYLQFESSCEVAESETPHNQNSTETNPTNIEHETTNNSDSKSKVAEDTTVDSADLPDYVNVTLPATDHKLALPPPIPPRLPSRKKF